MRREPSGTGGVRRGATIALALGIVALALGVRVAPRWENVVAEGDVRIADPDACYHLRRAERIGRSFPDLAIFDRFVNFPAGAHVIWPPLYDTALAGAVALFPSGAASRGPSIPVALLPPLLFGAAVLVLFRTARALWPGRPALWALAAGVPALLPASFPHTEIGQLDHHAAELLTLALAVHALGAALARERGAERAPITRPAARAALWPALALAAALATQLTLIALAALVALACATAPRHDRPRALALGAWICALAALLLAPLAWAYHASGAPFAHFRFGIYQPAMLLEAALLLGFGRALGAGARSRGNAFAAAGLGIASVALGAALAEETASGLSYLVRGFSRWQETIGESQSPFAAGFPAGIVALVISLSALIALAPVALVRLARAPAWRDPRRRVLFLAAAGATAAALLQTRFLPHCALFAGFFAAVALEKRRLTPWAGAAVAVALAPTLAGYGRVEETDLAFARSRSVLDFLARATPAVTDDARATYPPEYGVVAEWSYGHYIQYHGRRPAFVDNFGEHAADLAPVRALFLETDAARVAAALDSMRARYVLVRDLASNFEGLVPDRATWSRYAQSLDRAAGESATLSFRPEIQSTLLYRLAWRGGAGFLDERTGAWTPPVSSLRLVAESESLETIPGGPAVPFVKLYERVRGARVRVAGRAPGEEGALLATVRSPHGRLFPYVERLVADASGAWEAVVPYATEGAGRRDAAVLVKCEIASRSGTMMVPPIGETAVLEGAEIRVPAADSARGPRAGAPPP